MLLNRSILAMNSSKLQCGKMRCCQRAYISSSRCRSPTYRHSHARRWLCPSPALQNIADLASGTFASMQLCSAVPHLMPFPFEASTEHIWELMKHVVKAAGLLQSGGHCDAFKFSARSNPGAEHSNHAVAPHTHTLSLSSVSLGRGAATRFFVTLAAATAAAAASWSTPSSPAAPGRPLLQQEHACAGHAA